MRGNYPEEQIRDLAARDKTLVRPGKQCGQRCSRVQSNGVSGAREHNLQKFNLLRENAPENCETLTPRYGYDSSLLMLVPMSSCGSFATIR